jgi:hypothetical protein
MAVEEVVATIGAMAHQMEMVGMALPVSFLSVTGLNLE